MGVDASEYRVRHFALAFFCSFSYNTPAAPGLAKFGIALGLGPRDRGFKSRNPDQKSEGAFAHSDFCVIEFVEGLEQGGGEAAKNSPSREAAALR